MTNTGDNPSSEFASSGRVVPCIDAAPVGYIKQAASILTRRRAGRNCQCVQNERKRGLHSNQLPCDAVSVIGKTYHERGQLVTGGLASYVTGTQSFQEQNHAI